MLSSRQRQHASDKIVTLKTSTSALSHKERQQMKLRQMLDRSANQVKKAEKKADSTNPF